MDAGQERVLGDAKQNERPDAICRALSFSLSSEDLRRLAEEIKQHVDIIREHLSTGREAPSHIPGTCSICVPLTSITSPDDLFDVAAGDVAKESYEVTDFGSYWMTVHHSDVPVVLLLLKEPPPSFPEIQRIIDAATAEVGERIGGNTGVYLQWNEPGFAWSFHTDHEYEGVYRRLHVPIVTTDQNRMLWQDEAGEIVQDKFLEPGKVYIARTDLPHTAVNRHREDGRLHLIMDVGSSGA